MVLGLSLYILWWLAHVLIFMLFESLKKIFIFAFKDRMPKARILEKETLYLIKNKFPLYFLPLKKK